VVNQIKISFFLRKHRLSTRQKAQKAKTLVILTTIPSILIKCNEALNLMGLSFFFQQFPLIKAQRQEIQKVQKNYMDISPGQTKLK